MPFVSNREGGRNLLLLVSEYKYVALAMSG